ncbi:MAG: intradiol ring-cleavage dioxygenase [Rhodanobacteraceae bacterium]|nr:intradiol ring-cleavage dioxygenase [Rhodanobacteraceae bacterium]
MANQSGLTGVWYDASMPGQGFVIEVYPDLLGAGLGLLFGGWFTFDTQAGGTTAQRWYSFSGEIRGSASAVDLTIYRNTGGRFASAPVTFAQRVGSARIDFATCTSARFGFTLDDGRSGSLALTRGLANVVCADAGSSGDIDFAYSGSWYDPDSAGQGLILEYNPSASAAFMAWYTYADTDTPTADPSQQRWYTAQAVAAAGERSLAFTIYQTTGGRFATAGSVSTLPIGTAELSFQSCNAATLNWQFGNGELAGRRGTINLVRAGVAPGACAFSSTCALIPSETEGPYPLLAALSDSALRRSDLTEGRPGVPLTLVLKLVDINRGCAPLAGAAVYAWHCDKDGVYSGYSGQTGGVNATGQTFMRGVQTTNTAGQVVFQTIYPGWYAGRITHIHFRAWLSASTSGSGIITSQVAFPQDVTQAVYASTLYAQRGQNTSVTSFQADNVFRDGVSYQLANVAGSTSTGYVATLIVGVSA